MAPGESWPRAGYPLVPLRLRQAWAGEELPRATLDRAGLPHNTRVRDLDEGIWERVTSAESLAVVANYVLSLVRARLYHRGDPGLADLPLFPGPWRKQVKTKDLPLSRRTRNLLAKVPKRRRLEWLSSVSAASFLALRGAGPVSLLEFLTVAEAEGAFSNGAPKSSAEDVEGVRASLEALADRFPIDEITPGDPRLLSLELAGETIRKSLEKRLGAAARRGGDLAEVEALITAVSTALERLESQTLEESGKIPAVVCGWTGSFNDPSIE